MKHISRHLIRSLSLASGIDKTLLIFSHDVWDEQLNYLVRCLYLLTSCCMTTYKNIIFRSIDFAKVLQIFYPFSLQTHEHSFPGESHRDCPRDADVRRQRKIQENFIRSKSEKMEMLVFCCNIYAGFLIYIKHLHLSDL